MRVLAASVTGLLTLAGIGTMAFQAPGPMRALSQSPKGDLPAADSCVVAKLQAEIASPGGEYAARIETVEAGLRRVTVARIAPGETVAVFTDDVTSATWTPDSRGLVFGVSASYGVPGIYALDTQFGTIRTIVAAENLSDPAYPQGADWFGVCDIARAGNSAYLVHFMHSGHVDSLSSAEGQLTHRVERFSLPGD